MPGCATWMCNPKAKVSAHYLIDTEGSIFQLVEESECAWHAGRSAFDYNEDGSISTGEKSLNRRSIGIELESLGEEYSQKQLEANIALTKDIIVRHNILPKHVLGHKEIAPDRKWDPGNFNMAEFRETIKHRDLDTPINRQELPNFNPFSVNYIDPWSGME